MSDYIHPVRQGEIYRETIKIPEDAIVCPHCKGEGYFHFGRDGTFETDYSLCLWCEGNGYMTKERQAFFRRLEAENKKLFAKPKPLYGTS